MKKIQVDIDLSLIKRDKVRTVILKQGTPDERTAKYYSFDIVEKSDQKVVKTGVTAKGDKWVKYNTHFVAEVQTKEEREQKAKSNYIGNGYSMVFMDDGVDKEFDSFAATPVKGENDYPAGSEGELPF